MTQRGLFDGPVRSDEAVEAMLKEFRRCRRQAGYDLATIAAEVSQLRSMNRLAERVALSLEDLLSMPESAAALVNRSDQRVGHSTVLLRSRAIQNLAFVLLGEGEARSWIERYRAALPLKESKGWHDTGISLPGTRLSTRRRAPTPDADALTDVLAVSTSDTPESGALAGLAGFSGLDLDEMASLKWGDIRWLDQESGAPFALVKVRRRGHPTTCYVVAEGARPLLRLALASGLDRNSYVFPGRTQGEHLSVGALKSRLAALCVEAGWPGVTRKQLTGAFVDWLKRQDVDDHRIAMVLGRRSAATIDNLLRPIKRIDAQRRIDASFQSLDLWSQ